MRQRLLLQAAMVVALLVFLFGGLAMGWWLPLRDSRGLRFPFGELLCPAPGIVLESAPYNTNRNVGFVGIAYDSRMGTLYIGQDEAEATVVRAYYGCVVRR